MESRVPLSICFAGMPLDSPKSITYLDTPPKTLEGHIIICDFGRIPSKSRRLLAVYRFAPELGVQTFELGRAGQRLQVVSTCILALALVAFAVFLMRAIHFKVSPHEVVKARRRGMQFLKRFAWKADGLQVFDDSLVGFVRDGQKTFPLVLDKIVVERFDTLKHLELQNEHRIASRRFDKHLTGYLDFVTAGLIEYFGWHLFLLAWFFRFKSRYGDLFMAITGCHSPSHPLELQAGVTLRLAENDARGERIRSVEFKNPLSHSGHWGPPLVAGGGSSGGGSPGARFRMPTPRLTRSASTSSRRGRLSSTHRSEQYTPIGWT
jgi:hypothetical protein